jgi:hypothetical protein
MSTLESAIRLTRLDPLMASTCGDRRVRIALIDSPIQINASFLRHAYIESIDGTENHADLNCDAMNLHGTLLAALFGGAHPDGSRFGLCPECQIVAGAIFTGEAGHRGATADRLLWLIEAALNARASVINLSLAIMSPVLENATLRDLLDEAARRGVMVIAAAGNQSTVVGSSLASHDWVLPVTACDSTGNPLVSSNASISAARGGLRAPGFPLTGLLPSDGADTLGGTSIATAFVTATAALLRARFPDCSAAAILSALRGPKRERQGLIPPLLDAGAAMARLRISEHTLPGDPHMVQRIDGQRDNNVEPSACGCTQTDASTGTASTEDSKPNAARPAPSYIYAIGRIELRFPSIGIERELAQALAREDTTGKSHSEALHFTLSKPENRYLLRQLCWLLMIEGIPTYALVPRASDDYSLLVESVRPRPQKTDVDVVVGVKGPIAPAGVCNGLSVPVVFVDQIYSFDTDRLIGAIPRSTNTDASTAAAEDVFHRIQELADNAGAAAEHRALNYLAVRYEAIYQAVAEAYARGASMAAVDVKPSRLSGLRQVVDVIFSFRDRVTDGLARSFVRVDVTDEFPFLVTKLAPYYDR